MKADKFCPQCKVTKTINDFGKNRQRLDGRASWCKECSNRYSAELKRRYRIEALQHYSNSEVPSCSCCDETTFEFLAFDHIEGGGNKHMQQIGHNIVRWLRKNGYPPGFRVLCHNCNFARGHYGCCPHERKSSMKEFVAVVLRDDQGRVLTIHTVKPGRDCWELPGGKTEPGEPHVVTAIRELREEVGVEVISLSHLLTNTETVNGVAWTGHVYVAEAYTGTPRVMEPNKAVEVRFVTIEELRQLSGIPKTELLAAEALEQGIAA